MKNMTVLWVTIAVMLVFPLVGHAEVLLNGQSLTANLMGSSLAKTLDQIGQQGDIHIDVMDKVEYGKAVIFDVFEEVPLEQGLHRLLNGWNYGLSKDPTSGAVRTLMIISRRTAALDAPPLGGNVQIVSKTPEEQFPDEEFFKENFSDIVDEEPPLTDEELLNSMPPELREMVAIMQGQDGHE